MDEVVKPVKKEQKLETFKETKTEVKEEEKEEISEWDKYIQPLQEKYGKKVREVGEKGHYMIPVIQEDKSTKEVSFSLKSLSVKDLRWLAAKQKEYDEKPKKNLSLFEAEELASMYLEYAEMLLVNSKTGEPITKDIFENQDWGFIRSVVDDCILKSLVGSG